MPPLWPYIKSQQDHLLAIYIFDDQCFVTSSFRNPRTCTDTVPTELVNSLTPHGVTHREHYLNVNISLCLMQIPRHGPVQSVGQLPAWRHRRRFVFRGNSWQHQQCNISWPSSSRTVLWKRNQSYSLRLIYWSTSVISKTIIELMVFGHMPRFILQWPDHVPRATASG